LSNKAKNHGGGNGRTASGRPQRPRDAFIFGARATRREESQPKKLCKRGVEAGGADRGKAVPSSSGGDPVAAGPFEVAELTEGIKALLEVAREQHYLTYDDINDLLPEGVSPNDLEAL